jgi:HAMP domain-containing protein
MGPRTGAPGGDACDDAPTSSPAVDDIAPAGLRMPGLVGKGQPVELPVPDPTTWLEAPGPIVTCWLPAIAANEDPSHRRRLEWRHAREQVPDAPAAALEAIDALLSSERAHLDAESLLLFAGPSGDLAGVRLPDLPTAARAWVDALPRLGGALAARQQVVPHLVVIADRAGADIEVVDHQGPISASVLGDTMHLHRSHPGGWSQRRFQQRAENTWERNATGVAGEVDALRQQVGARLVVVAGDPRAVGFLTEHASERLRSVLHHVEGAGRSDHDPFAEVADEVRRLEAAIVGADLDAVVDRFTATRQSGHVADGPDTTLGLLSQGRVADVLLVDDPDDERRAWFARGARQASVDRAPLDRLGVDSTEGRLVDVAIWGAHATGATVHLLPSGHPDAPTGGIGGLLRG